MAIVAINVFYSAGMYRGSEGRERWAVFNSRTHTWTFPDRYGKKAAEQLARKLNAQKLY